MELQIHLSHTMRSVSDMIRTFVYCRLPGETPASTCYCVAYSTVVRRIADIHLLHLLHSHRFFAVTSVLKSGAGINVHFPSLFIFIYLLAMYQR